VIAQNVSQDTLNYYALVDYFIAVGNITPGRKILLAGNYQERAWNSI